MAKRKSDSNPADQPKRSGGWVPPTVVDYTPFVPDDRDEKNMIDVPGYGPEIANSRLHEICQGVEKLIEAAKLVFLPGAHSDALSSGRGGGRWQLIEMRVKSLRVSKGEWAYLMQRFPGTVPELTLIRDVLIRIQDRWAKQKRDFYLKAQQEVREGRMTPQQLLQVLSAAGLPARTIGEDEFTILKQAVEGLRVALGLDKKAEYLGIRLDDDQFIAERAGSEVTISFGGPYLEWHLFKLLVERGDQFTQKRLLESAWGSSDLDDKPDNSNVYRAISNLRAKIRPLELCIQAQRKLGWKIVEQS
jgi:hypothetical protein